MEGTLEITFTVPLSCPFFVLDSVKETKLQAVVTVIGDVSNFFLDNSPKRGNFLNAVFNAILFFTMLRAPFPISNFSS